jgi:cell division protein ZapA
MGEVNITIKGKSYGIACDDGQEHRVAHMGQYVDGRLREIASAGAASSDAHLLVLTSLVLADEIHELRNVLQYMVPADGSQPVQRVTENDERLIVESINHLTQKINNISQRLEAAA